MALKELFEKARQAKVTAVEKLVIRFFDPSATWKVHQAMATLKEAEVNCRFEADIKQEGINSFQLEFDGRMDNAEIVYWEDVEPLVQEAVRQRVAEFQEAGIGGVDLYLASSARRCRSSARTGRSDGAAPFRNLENSLSFRTRISTPTPSGPRRPRRRSP